MNRAKLIFVVAALVAVGSIWFFGMPYRPSEDRTEEGKITIATSFYPLAYFASQIGGDVVTVNDLTPAGTEPHDFEPSLRELALLGSVDLFVYNGGSFEPWVEQWLAGEFKHPRGVIDMIAELEVRNVPLVEYQGSHDPHVWLDPILAKSEAEIIRDTLISIDPAHEEIYRLNTEHLIASLDELHALFVDGLATCVIREAIASHEAFGYLAKRYDLSIVSIAGISPDEEPSPKDLAKMVDHARSKGISYIFFETMASSKLAETIAREIGGGILVLNPLEGLTEDERSVGDNYHSVMEKNLSSLRAALSCI